jgi:hypothetical protein
MMTGILARADHIRLTRNFSASTLCAVSRTRLFRALLAAFLAVWLGAIVPGHRRGIVQLPEARCESNCCATTNRGSKSSPATKHCAICYFALTLSNPPTIVPDLNRFNLVERLAPLVAMRSASIPCFTPYFGRAPPGEPVA